MFSIVLRFLSELGRFQIKIARRSDAVKLNSDFILIFIKFETGYRLPEIYVTVTFFSFPIIILFHCHLIKWLCHIEKGQMIGCEDESSADWIAAMSGWKLGIDSHGFNKHDLIMQMLKCKAGKRLLWYKNLLLVWRNQHLRYLKSLIVGCAMQLFYN